MNLRKEKLQDKSKKGKDLETSAPLPLPQRKKIERVNVKPIGENTIPYQYSKEIGRNGGHRKTNQHRSQGKSR